MLRIIATIATTLTLLLTTTAGAAEAKPKRHHHHKVVKHAKATQAPAPASPWRGYVPPAPPAW